MEQENLQPLSGFRDYQLGAKDTVTQVLREVFYSFNYQALETPIIERQSILLDKFGGEAEKLLYLFEDNGGRKVGLRYDLTVPLARFVAANRGKLTMPWRRFEIGPVFRAERPQAGRYRQFTQGDIDIVGAATGAELEILEIIKAVGERLDLKFRILINDRRLVDRAMEDLGIGEGRKKVLIALDKRDKYEDGDEGLKKALSELGLSKEQLDKVSQFFLSQSAQLTNFDQEIAKDLQELIDRAKDLGIEVEFRPSMVRGLDYYTSTIIEVEVEDKAGQSVGGGGRYDNLIESLTGDRVPAVGFSFGVDRLASLLEQRPVERTALLVFAGAESSRAQVREWVAELRAAGRVVEIFACSDDLSAALKYADRSQMAKVAIVEADTWRSGSVRVKYMQTGEQVLVSRDEV